MIAFIGSVFSPYYAWARRSPAADPRQHCALNVALYGPGANRWAMTERGAGDLQTSCERLQIGPSSLHWDGNTLSFRIEEVCAPLPSRIRGTVRVAPHALIRHTLVLDQAGQHRWCPIATRAHVEVNLTAPALRWSGEGYCDSNFGAEPLEQRLRSWNWSRGQVRKHTIVLYDVLERSGRESNSALCFDPQGEVRAVEPPPSMKLPRTGWRIARTSRSEQAQAQVVRTLEDTPFYARSLISAQLLGEPTLSVHESLDLDRFRSPIVQAMLPFRMPRRARRT